MDIHEDPEPDKVEKAVRFGCGAMLGLVVGIIYVIRLALSSLPLCIVVIVGAILVCGFLALKHGDAFWFSIFGSK